MQSKQGKCVEVFYKDLFVKYGKEFEGIGVELKNGYGDLFNKLDLLDPRNVVIDNCIYCMGIRSKRFSYYQTRWY
ncbi:NADP-dependent isocitrate dehydrogenase [bacterium]|nr:NADP-dependent isocitrate dehydrogenase [bacterium]